jgi:hypothetical protein
MTIARVGDGDAVAVEVTGTVRRASTAGGLLGATYLDMGICRKSLGALKAHQAAVGVGGKGSGHRTDDLGGLIDRS